ncbi:hypothetical protein NP233_g11324 [Leucocoprinus birnbaumii]|uniref:JmjC domain-containing protein n=1 Tax=Leucocoprinus birnbaumii TaxID=56174 RepID=A0AAD5VGM3_9AGAR|nr:hypothetical protein NP233_g11324 [Leucocoprinus birnbaumii]
MTQAPESKALRRKLARWISDEYRDLNGSHIETLDRPPSALEFSRLIHVSRPVKIKSMYPCFLKLTTNLTPVSDFTVPATHKWTNDYLVRKMVDRRISIAITPNGRADAVTRGLDDKPYFVEPHVEQMSMQELLSRLADQGADPSSNIHYLQSQNGNLYSSEYFSDGGHSLSEFEPLRDDVPSQVSWCSEALDRCPDAVNLWIGDGRSTTSIHSDPYENIYTVVRGEKRFTLLPPSDGWCLKVRWSSILDPSLPNTLPTDITPIQVRLRPGEALYLPTDWWHYVQQAKETTIAINWWYDMEMRGMHWVFLNFLRNQDGLYVDGGEDEEADVLTI